MIKKIIIFGDFASSNFDDRRTLVYQYFKSAAVFRIAYQCRKIGYEVKTVHHCTSFNKAELKKIIDDFANGEPYLACVSTSFLANTNFTSHLKLSDSTGSSWGTSAFQFLLNIASICKNLKQPLVIGGFEITKELRFDNDSGRKSWGIDILDSIGVDYYISGNDISILDDICLGKRIDYEKIKTSKFVKVDNIADFSDWSSSPIIEDYISDKECLTTEIAAGCVFSCSFCDYGMLGKKKNQFVRSYESLKTELLSNYNNFGTRMYMLTDNMVNDYKEKLFYLKRIREETGIDFRWTGFARLDIINTIEHAQLLKDSGVAGLIFGIESMKKEVGPYLGKMTDRDKLIKNLRLVRSVIEDTATISVSLIAGAPTETLEDLQTTYNWLTSDEGSYLIDHFRFGPLFVSPAQLNDRNEINRSRNNPFRDYYFKTKKDSITGRNWTSPWGTYDQFKEISMQFDRNFVSNSFSLPILCNVTQLDVDEVIHLIRKKMLIPNSYGEGFTCSTTNSINEYRQRMLKMLLNT